MQEIINDPVLRQAAIDLVSTTELMAKMNDDRKYKGCSAAYISTILTQDDARFKGRDLNKLRWDIIDMFHFDRSLHTVAYATYATVPKDKFKEHFG